MTSERRCFEDIMFDTDPLGLADDWTTLEEPLLCDIECDESPQTGQDIYFGLSTVFGETIEVRAEVEHVELKDDRYRAQVRILASDTRFAAMLAGVVNSAPAEPTAEQPMWASGIRQTNGTFAVIVDSPAGLLKAEQLAKIADLASKGAGLVKLTHAQRVIVLVRPEQLESIQAELDTVGLRIGVLHHGVRNIRACCASLCRLCQSVDGLQVAESLSALLFGRATCFDVKIAISDCARNCSEAYCADIGLLGSNGKYDIVIGGRGSKIPFRAIRLATGVRTEDAPAEVVRITKCYETLARKGERFHAMLERLGAEDAGGEAIPLPEDILASLSDGVDEAARIRAHLARAAGVKHFQAALARV